MMTWAEKFAAEATEKGLQQGLRKGLQQGKEDGMRELLLRLLKQRFRKVPAAAKRRVASISSTDELASLAERVLTSRSLEDLGLL